MPGTNLNNLDAYNEVATTLGGAGGDLNDMATVRAIAVLEGVSGGPADVSDDNMTLRLNAIDVDAGGAGGHLNTLDALNSIVILKGGVGGHENDLDAINEWVDFAAPLILDQIPGAVVAYSVRRLSSTYSGSLLRVRRSSDDAELDIGFDNNGDLDTAAMESFVGGGNDGFVATWYDQSSNGNDATQSTASQQPQIVSSGTTIVHADTGEPALQGDLDNNTPFDSNIALGAFSILLRCEWTTGTRNLLRHITETNDFLRMVTPTGFDLRIGSLVNWTTAQTAGTLYDIIVNRTGSTPELFIDNVSQGTRTLGGTLDVNQYGFSSSAFDRKINTIIIWNSFILASTITDAL